VVAGSVDALGRVLDRLAGLEQVIPPEVVCQSLAESGCGTQRACRLGHEVMLWVVLAMGVFTGVPIRQVFKRCRFARLHEKTPSRSALCQGRQRLGVGPVRRVFERVAGPLGGEAARGVFYHGLRLVGVDSTVYDLPDTEANAAAFGRPSGGHRGPGAFPQVRKVSLVELGTHAEIAFVAKPCRRSETVAAPALLKKLPAGSLLLWDRGFFSYRLWKQALFGGAPLLVRMKEHVVLGPVRSLPDGSFLAKVYPSPKARRHDAEGLLVRVIRYTLDDPQRVGHGEVHVLVTSLLDPRRHPASELVGLYHERWEHESAFDEQQTHHDPRRPTKPADLRSQTPAGVVQELYTLSLGHFVVRALMARAAERADLDPDRLSFTGCFQTLVCRLPECRAETPRSFAQWCDGLLWELSQERTEPRRNRVNPRVVKQKVSKWKKKRAEHHGLPPLKKTFAESVVMLR
jgi:hypothetical protein